MAASSQPNFFHFVNALERGVIPLTLGHLFRSVEAPVLSKKRKDSSLWPFQLLSQNRLVRFKINSRFGKCWKSVAKMSICHLIRCEYEVPRSFSILAILENEIIFVPALFPGSVYLFPEYRTLTYSITRFPSFFPLACRAWRALFADCCHSIVFFFISFFRLKYRRSGARQRPRLQFD